MVLRVILVNFLWWLNIYPLYSAPVFDYLPKASTYLSSVSTPESVLGFGIGDRHPRHDQLINYFQRLAEQSERVQLTNMGFTPEYRQQLLVTISASENLAQLPQILAHRAQHLPPEQNQPNVVWLGYSVHGDEISGANAAMVVAYYLAASTDPYVKQLLQDTIVVLEPSINPDGMDRFVNWVNTFRGKTLNADPNHIEHHQHWFTGRTNHFAFDLNRDWLLLAQPETQHRLGFYHLYQPNVLGDFHEMGANSSYFFQPGIASRTNPLTPKANIELTSLLAQYHAKALDAGNRLYFTQEAFDDFYYGKGSTYPDINGAIGILFEQASSRGMAQQTENGLLSFEFGIQNHVTSSLSTLEGAWRNRAKLADYRFDFYQQAEKLAKKDKFSGYLLHEAKDLSRLSALLNKLAQHQIKVYQLASDFRVDGRIYPQQSSYFVPLAQPQYRLIKTLFDQVTEFADNTFYDVSGWTMPLAMNIETHQLERTWGLKLAAQPWQPARPTWQQPAANQYAYVFEWHDFMAPKLLNELLNQGIKLRVATRAFSAEHAGQQRDFAPGTIVIPAGIQVLNQWQELLFSASQASNLPLFSLSTGLTLVGVDIGSNALMELKPVKVLLVGGEQVSSSEVGELLFYLDQTLAIAVTIVEQSRLADIQLSDYSHLMMVDGNYHHMSAKVNANISQWLKQGGVVFGQKRGAKWLAEQNILKVDFVNSDRIGQAISVDGLTYQDKESLAARKRIAGAIFETQLDITNPLTYGLTPTLPVFRNSTLMLAAPSKPFISIANYSDTPLLSGYTDAQVLAQLSQSPAIVAHNVGLGRVIATNDVLAFRGYWYGTSKIIANSLFFAKAFDVEVTD